MKIRVGAQLCWTCQKACGGCAWSDTLEPVPGWTAVPVRMRYRDGKALRPREIDTYSITACPEYAEDKRAVELEPECTVPVFREAICAV